MVLAAVSLLADNPNPSVEEVKVALAGNLCRCTGYTRIFEAVLQACREAPGPA
jgi:aerobic-type carbon monoxide dehydrogenase small subunit (CoxS/CutS family)